MADESDGGLQKFFIIFRDYWFLTCRVEVDDYIWNRINFVFYPWETNMLPKFFFLLVKVKENCFRWHAARAYGLIDGMSVVFLGKIQGKSL